MDLERIAETLVENFPELHANARKFVEGHFPSASESQLEEFATTILNGIVGAGLLEAILPIWEIHAGHQRTLTEAEKSLRQAYAALSKPARFSKQAELSLKEFENVARFMSRQRAEAVEPYRLEGRVDALLQEVIQERQEVDRLLQEFEKALGLRPLKRGRKPKILAERLAAALGEIYFAFSGKSPSVTTDPTDGSAKGIFFDLVADAFDKFEVNAQPEGYARAEVKRFKEEMRRAD